MPGSPFAEFSSGRHGMMLRLLCVYLASASALELNKTTWEASIRWAWIRVKSRSHRTFHLEIEQPLIPTIRINQGFIRPGFHFIASFFFHPVFLEVPQVFSSQQPAKKALLSSFLFFLLLFISVFSPCLSLPLSLSLSLFLPLALSLSLSLSPSLPLSLFLSLSLSRSPVFFVCVFVFVCWLVCLVCCWFRSG